MDIKLKEEGDRTMKKNIIIICCCSLIYLFYLILVSIYNRIVFPSGIGWYFLLYLTLITKTLIKNKWENELFRDIIFFIALIVVILDAYPYAANYPSLIILHLIFLIYNITIRIIINIKKDTALLKALFILNTFFMYILILPYFKNVK